MVKLYGWLPQLAWSNQPAICSIVVLATLTASSVAHLFKSGYLLCYWSGYLRLPRIFIAFGPGSWCRGGRAYHQHNYMLKISSKQVKQFFYLDWNDCNERKKKLGDHKLDDYDRRPFSNQTFNFVWLTKCYCEFDYVWLPNPIVHLIRYAGNKGPRDWQKVFTISRFRQIKVLFHNL